MSHINNANHQRKWFANNKELQFQRVKKSQEIAKQRFNEYIKTVSFCPSCDGTDVRFIKQVDGKNFSSLFSLSLENVINELKRFTIVCNVCSPTTRNKYKKRMPSEHRSDRLREYDRQWKKSKRKKWLDENGGACVLCGCTENLEVDHINRSEKLYSITSLWGLSDTNPKKLAELAKCQILCHDCHLQKTIAELKR